MGDKGTKNFEHGKMFAEIFFAGLSGLPELKLRGGVSGLPGCGLPG
jgi:hypothetical protein